MFKVNNKNTRTTSLTSFWCFYCSLWTYFTPFSSVLIVDFEQVNVIWVNSLHERCLRLIYIDRISSYEELLDKNKSVSVHQKNLQELTIKIFKTYTGIASQIMNEVFSRNCPLNYNLCRYHEWWNTLSLTRQI